MTLYHRLFPYHAELCALSELRKRPGFGAPLRSGIGGHALLYLNGVRLDRSAQYPTLRLCTADEPPENFGCGISVNSHYRNANWVAVEDQNFLWHGALAPGERLTREAYHRTQGQAQKMDFLAGVEFHPEFFAEKPAGMSLRDFMYEISIATDYAAAFGRRAWRARVPLDRPRMAKIIDYLNAINEPYRTGAKIYRWKILNDNCMHIARNALAAAGIWSPWPTGQSPLLAAFQFPVPKNGFVDLALRANTLPIDDPDALQDDIWALRALKNFAALPTAPGGLVSAHQAVKDNDIYDVQNLRLIFFDNPVLGPYRFHFKTILASPAYTDLRTNFLHFAQLYAAAQARLTAKKRSSRRRTLFQASYEAYIGAEIERTKTLLAQTGDAA